MTAPRVKLSDGEVETLTPVQRRQLQLRVSRWLRDEQWISKSLKDERQYSNKTEILRNLGTAIAYGQRQLSAGRAALLAGRSEKGDAE